MPPPPGVPDITHLGDSPQRILGVAVAFLTVTWFSVALRVWVRAITIRSFGWDDWTILLTMVTFTVQCVYLIRMIEVEMDPEKNNNLTAIAGLVTDVIAYTGAYVLTTVFLKVSLALFFLRIIIQPWQRFIIYAALITYSTYGLVYFGITVFACGDPSKYLAHTVEGKCISIKNVIIPASYAQTALNALTDWIYAILPIFTLIKLNMPKVTKFWACILLGLGALGSIASLIRLEYVKGLLPGPNFFKDSVGTAIWATIEPGLGIAAASFATLRPMLKRCLETTRTLTSSQRGASKIPSGMTPSSMGDIALKGLGPRSHERAGFRPFDSRDSQDRPDTQVQVAHVDVRHDSEKAYQHPWERGTPIREHRS